MADDQYDEREVQAIFDLAADPDFSARSRLARRQGMSLAELQEIAREVGLDPEAVADAARTVRGGAAAAPVPAPTFLRIPVGVGRSVDLDRPLTDDEWGGLVAQLRSTFNAGGSVRTDGAYREWRNGNLRVTGAPTGAGYRIEMRTSKGSARSLMTAGGVMVGISGAIFTAEMLTVGMGSAGIGAGFSEVGTLLIVGAGLFGAGALQLPAWMRRRREQFDALAARLRDAIRD